MVTLLGTIALATVDEQFESIAEAEPRFERRIELAGRYVQARTGRTAVAGVVLSAAEQEPIVAVAVPFDTPRDAG